MTRPWRRDRARIRWAEQNVEKMRAYRRRWARKQWARTHPERALRRARAVVGPDRSTLTYLRDPLHDDLMAEALLAILEGDTDDEARERVRAYRSREHSWGRKTRALPPDDLMTAAVR